MNDMIDFLTSKEIIVVYIVVAVACLLCFIIYLVDKNQEKRKRKNNTRKLNKLVDDVNLRMQSGIDDGHPKKKVVSREENTGISAVKEEINVSPASIANREVNNKQQINSMNSAPSSIPAKMQEPITTMNSQVNIKNEAPLTEPTKIQNRHPIESLDMPSTNSMMDKQINNVQDQIEELLYTDPEPNREEATRELIKLTEELEKAERLQRDNKIDITAYENSQEENAIISIDELNRKGKEMYSSNEITQYADEGNEPISLEDLDIRKSKTINLEEVQRREQPKIEFKEENHPQQRIERGSKNYVNSGYKGNVKSFHQPMISPIYGLEKKIDEDYDDDAKYDIEEDELAKTSEFLLSLKDLQNRLES